MLALPSTESDETKRTFHLKIPLKRILSRTHTHSISETVCVCDFVSVSYKKLETKTKIKNEAQIKINKQNVNIYIFSPILVISLNTQRSSYRTQVGSVDKNVYERKLCNKSILTDKKCKCEL